MQTIVQDNPFSGAVRATPMRSGRALLSGLVLRDTRVRALLPWGDQRRS